MTGCEGLLGTDLQICQAARAAETAAAAAAKLADGNGLVDSIVALSGAVAALLLPLAALFLIVRLWPVVRSILETRKFTIKIGGFELSAQEATDQLADQLRDLQDKVAGLIAAVPAAPAPASKSAFDDPFGSLLDKPFKPSAPPDAGPAAPPRRILWLDDNPSNNAALIAAFQGDGLAVETATTGNEALSFLRGAPNGYAAVISDQGRVEAGRYKSDAGTAFVKEVREAGLGVPVALFTTARGERMSGEALREGAEIVTSSATDLRAFVMRHVRGPERAGRA